MSFSKDSMFSSAGYYRIDVQGRLQKEWEDRLGSMKVVSYQDDGRSAWTLLQGTVMDQTELAGILKTLYELQLSIRSVNFIGKQL